ncbi:bifunctional diguanylate cyclase/phosphodiesterase [Curvibacter sp. APW13]|uniref:putative bifunctional diguanylate cyclase/phosphodiesterase n=1 Tax=Curvibacter sp. APW13 TaxID=3077236 RepID=UPI0028DE3CAC|nr:bifunctional diguanylate cyclase/phosphodiesterase [Curvibacter sp. APW13]MDT8990800.1 bifunctional diguanylate cyclase/phosphodiesterase [Curvibacter sp. APW13]
MFEKMGVRAGLGARNGARLNDLVRLYRAQGVVETAAAYGRWWYDQASGAFAVSHSAARILHVEAGVHASLDEGLMAVVQDDLADLADGIAAGGSAPCEREFRVVSAAEGVRWVRLQEVPELQPAQGVRSGIVRDVSALKMAAMREGMGFAMTQYLIGAQTPEETRAHVIALICQHLGWDWGAYWAVQNQQGADAADGPLLRCESVWQASVHDTAEFTAGSCAVPLRAGQGLVGTVWSSGEPAWVEDVGNSPTGAQRYGRRACGLRSGYAFPVTYVDADGQRHMPGVLEFYSVLGRQPDAQLPRMSQTIGAMLAQMSQRLEHQAQVLRLAQVDDMTGLFNRSHFHACLARACEAGARAGEGFGLVYIDLDRFKPINDAYGHEAGNAVLREFAQRLQGCLVEGAVAARLGGDEFALLVPADALGAVAALLEQVLLAASAPFQFEGHELTVSASVGLASFPEDGDSVAALLQSADAAMYRVKNSGRNAFHISAGAGAGAVAQQQTALAQRLALESDLHHALAGEGLHLVYQPIVDATTGHMQALEALIRWRRGDGSLVSPETFIPIAEQSHLIVKIGRWVLSRACRDLAQLRAVGCSGLRMHINMAASEFTSDQLLQTLQDHMAAWQLPPDALCLELTEGMLMQRPDQVIPVMRALRRQGVGISLDDFGMGHSSLALLRTLPISSLKIDRSFVRDLATQRNDYAIVKTIIDLGQLMGLEVIAEGIETVPQRDLLAQAGCVHMQGYLFDRPLTLDALLARAGGACNPEPGRCT